MAEADVRVTIGAEIAGLTKGLEEADQFRDIAANGGFQGGGGGGKSVSVSPQSHFHIHSMDSATVASTLMDNNGAVMKAIEQAVRHGAHLGLKNFR